MSMKNWIVIGYYSDGRVWWDNEISAVSVNQAAVQACQNAVHPNELTIVAVVDWENGTVHSPRDGNALTQAASEILATVTD